jgi:hypothetical protein
MDGRRLCAHDRLNPSLGEALIERGDVRRERDGVWIDGEGRRTSAIAEALIWALVTIAEGE